MPRKPRSLVLTDNCTTHKVWRAHNREYYLQSHRVKKLYINSLIKAQGEHEDYEMNAITLMTNHVHEVMKIFKLKKFSDLMRNHHSRFGLTYNKIHKRSGKVAEARPHTTCFEEDSDSMDAVFYTHANPYKARMVKEGQDYHWSTHQYYAHGKKPKFLEGVKFKFPKWYMDLGKTFEERQKKYRKLFNKYLKKVLSKKIYNRYSKLYFQGSPEWTFAKNQIVKSYFKDKRDRKENSP